MTHKPLLRQWKIYTGNFLQRQSVHARSVLDSLAVELAAEPSLAKPLIQQALTTPGCENSNCIVFNPPVVFLGEDLFTYVLCEGPGLGPPRSPPTPLLHSVGSCRGEAPGASEGYSGVKPLWAIHRAGLWSRQTLCHNAEAGADHSAGQGGCSANGTSTPSYTVLVAESHKRAQEDANQDEWHFFSSSPHHHPLCSFYTNQRFSFAVAQRQPLHRQPPIRAR